jgi:hypothetical protein
LQELSDDGNQYPIENTTDNNTDKYFKVESQDREDAENNSKDDESDADAESEISQTAGKKYRLIAPANTIPNKRAK